MKEEEKDLYLARIFSGIAHEIRNPLQGIMASVAALSCRTQDETVFQPFLQIIHGEALRINEIIDALLELSHPIIFDLQSHSLAKLTEDTIRTLGEETLFQSAIIEAKLEKELPHIKADSQKLTRALAEILRNAVQSNINGGRVQVELQGGGDSNLVLTVRDDGAGISRENLPKVFEPFFSTYPKKVGLGLSLADRIIRAHRGHIRLQSELGKGTLVSIYLPFYE